MWSQMCEEDGYPLGTSQNESTKHKQGESKVCLIIQGKPVTTSFRKALALQKYTPKVAENMNISLEMFEK